jgi:hypothetical protein
VWKWTLRFSPPPKRWMTVAEPDRPARMPERRARCRWKPSSTRTDTASTPPAPARDPTRARPAAGTAGSAPRWRTGTRGSTPSTSRAARSVIRRPDSVRSPAPCTKTAPPLERALRAPPARDAGSQDTTRQEVAELLLHEGRQRQAVRLPPGRLEEGVEVLVARLVVADAARHNGDIGAPRGRSQGPARDTPQCWGRSGKDRESSASVVTPHAGHPRGRVGGAQARPARGRRRRGLSTERRRAARSRR